jgi:hypothetical protein
MKLLGINSDAKTVKGLAFGWLTAICYLAPARIAILASDAVKTVCAFATAECTAACLYSAGRGSFSNVQKARIAKTRLWLESPEKFLEMLRGEIHALEKSASRQNLKAAVRLNGTSDIRFEKSGIMAEFPNVQFYDYTKYPLKAIGERPANYDLTYSYTGLEISRTFASQWLAAGVNVAAVFRGGLPKTFLNHPVIDGDKSDLRFLDARGVIVGLKAKGKARTGISSFVTDVVNGEAVIAAAGERTVPADKPTAIQTSQPLQSAIDEQTRDIAEFKAESFGEAIARGASVALVGESGVDYLDASKAIRIPAGLTRPQLRKFLDANFKTNLFEIGG